MSGNSTIDWLERMHWQRWVAWTVFLFLVYELRDFFFLAFVTFLLCFLVRSVVRTLSNRLSPGRPRIWLDRVLTLATFLFVLAIMIVAGAWFGPRLVRQSRTLLASNFHLNPQVALHGLLSRSVGTLLMRQTYGGPTDQRFQQALHQYEQDQRLGQGWYTEFPALEAHLKARFEAQFEADEQRRIAREVAAGSRVGDQFDRWFLRVKAPALFAQNRDAYLGEWSAQHPDDDDSPTDPSQADATPDKAETDAQRDEQIRSRILSDVKADPVALAELQREWEKSLVAQRWLAYRRSPGYQSAFADFYQSQHEAKPDALPFSLKTYQALRAAYPKGAAAFGRVLQTQSKSLLAESDTALQRDFELATRRQLAQDWWTNNPLAASFREHASASLPGIAAAIGGRLERLVRSLLTLPTQIVTALLLTLFICFDMLRLRESLSGLRESRIKHFYNEIVPGLVVFARLIGRSFAAQALIAVCNTLLTFLLLTLLGIENEVLLCLFVFIGSFIPVLGVLLSGLPILLQAVLQPDGSLLLGMQAIAGILVIHLIETSLLSPKIVGKVSHLHPVAVLIILVIGEHFFGVWGLLLGVPVAVYLIRVVILKLPIPGIYEPTAS